MSLRTRLLALAVLVLCSGMQCPPDGSLLAATAQLPSSAQPAETPGTPGVAVTNPKLLAQFGAGADLNRAIYTRYRLKGSGTPDAILVLVPGFQGGAGGFEILAEQLMRRGLSAHGRVFEVWAFDRRSNLLEDSEGLDIAERTLDAQIALDWLFGAELGLSLSPELAAGPNRRAVFYNTSDDVPFIASWTPQVHSFDIDAVVAEAQATALGGNVFLGGHSAGTGFVARYAATDFDLTGAGPAQPGHANLRGLVLLEGGGGSLGTPPSEETLDRIEARFDGGLFGAVRDQAPRCVGGATPCTVATEATDCAAFANDRCTEPTDAYATLLGIAGPELFAAVEPTAMQAIVGNDTERVILQVEQGGIPDNTAILQVPGLAALQSLIPDATPMGAIGTFIDDDNLISSFASFVATSAGAPGPLSPDGLRTWWTGETLDPGSVPANIFADNGPAPTTLPAGVWGVEREDTDLVRMLPTFYRAGTNFVDAYFPSAGLSVTSGIGLDSTALSADPPLGRGRRDIANLVEAPSIGIPVIAFGGTNGLVPVPGELVPFGSSIGPCTAPSCDGVTPRVVDALLPNEAFPTLGGVPGGFEFHVSEGYSHVDVLTATDGPANQVVAPLAAFLDRNIQ